MNRIEIRHTTRYDFEAAVTLGPHTLHLRPREGHDLRIAASALDIVPKATLGWRSDLYDNVLGVAAFAGWKGFDPTNGTLVGPDHIPVAVHRHPEAIAPVAGTFTAPLGSMPALTVDVHITRLEGH